MPSACTDNNDSANGYSISYLYGTMYELIKINERHEQISPVLPRLFSPVLFSRDSAARIAEGRKSRSAPCTVTVLALEQRKYLAALLSIELCVHVHINSLSLLLPSIFVTLVARVMYIDYKYVTTSETKRAKCINAITLYCNYKIKVQQFSF